MAHLNTPVWENTPERFPEWEIQVIGSRQFQNSLLAAILSRELRISCYCKVVPDKPSLGKDKQLLLVDLNEPGTPGDPAALVRGIMPLLQDSVLALFNTDRNADYTRQDIITLKVKGIFFQNEPLELFLKGVCALLNGNHWFPRELMNQWIKQSGETRGALSKNNNTSARITPREEEILMLIAQGDSNGEISDKLNISYHTVKTHLSNIYKKINVSNRLQASLWSSKNLLQPQYVSKRSE